MSEQIVTGVLINQPDKSIEKWISSLCLTYICYSVYVYIIHTHGYLNSNHWIAFILTLFILGFQIPLCGLRAVKSSHTQALACFGSIQGCLGCWHMLSALSIVITIGFVISVCNNCQPIFDAGNETCTIDEFSIHGRSNTVDINVQDCEADIPTWHQIISVFLLLALSLISFTVAFRARKTVKQKVAHIVTIEGLHAVGTINVVPQIPEDVCVSDENRV